MTRGHYNPLRDPDAVLCPAGCGWLTDDPYGGPCAECWAELGLDGDAAPRRRELYRVCTETCIDTWPLPVRPMVTVRAARGLL